MNSMNLHTIFFKLIQIAPNFIEILSTLNKIYDKIPKLDKLNRIKFWIPELNVVYLNQITYLTFGCHPNLCTFFDLFKSLMAELINNLLQNFTQFSWIWTIFKPIHGNLLTLKYYYFFNITSYKYK